MLATDRYSCFWRNICHIILVALALTLLSTSASQQGFWFPPSLVSEDEQTVADLSHFEKGGQLPGDYQVEMWLNDSLFSTRNISFVKPDKDQSSKDSTGLIACLTHEDLLELGVRPDMLENVDEDEEKTCLAPGRFIPQAETFFDFQKMRLDISIPQAALVNRPRGWLPPEQWDEGITAALFSYNFSGGENQGRYGNSRNYFLRLNSGFNVGPWRVRDDRTWAEYESNLYHYRYWQHGSTYLERAIIPWRSRLTLGDATTNGEVFDSLGFRGVQIMTEDSMYPESQRGFAPIIRATAMTNANVSIRQNGYEVYQINVAPGDFIINDLFPMYASGDLEVRVTEADGSIRTFTVPYSTVPLLRREGRIKYDVTAGKLRNSSEQYEEPFFLQSRLIWGLPYGLTAYGGMQYADNYQAGSVGAGINLGWWGAVSADVTHANSTLTNNSRHKGHSMRFLYGRSLNDFGTTFQLTGWRYSTQGFYSLDETALKDMNGWHYEADTVDKNGKVAVGAVTDYYNLYDNKRQRLQVNISQHIGNVGSLYLTGSRQTYWNRSGVSESLQAGFSSSLQAVNYSLSFNQSRTAGLERSDRSFFLNLSLSLDRWLPTGKSSVYATMSGSRDNNGDITQQAGLNGSLLEQRNLKWSVMQGVSHSGGESGSASLNYQGTYGNANLGYSHSRIFRQTSYGVAGGAILHRNGLTLSQPLGDTSVLVVAPGAAGIPLENSPGMKTDWRGYTVRPYAISYRENRIALDTSKLDDRTEIDNAVSRTIPTRGAIVRAVFYTRSGLRVLMTLKHNSKPLPFGTTVSSGDHSSIVGDDGQVFLSGLGKKGVLKAKWGLGADQQCTVNYRITDEAMQDALVQHEAECQ